MTDLPPPTCADRLRTLVDTSWLGTGAGRLVRGRVAATSLALWRRGSPYPLLLRATIRPAAEGSTVTCRCALSPDGLAIFVAWCGCLTAISVALVREGIDEMPALLLRHNGMLLAGVVTSVLGLAGIVATVIALRGADDDRLLLAFLRDALQADGADASVVTPRRTYLHGPALAWTISLSLSGLLWWPLGQMIAQERACPHDDRAGFGEFMTLGMLVPIELLVSLLLRARRSISPLQLLLINSAPLALVLLELLAHWHVWSWR